MLDTKDGNRARAMRKSYPPPKNILFSETQPHLLRFVAEGLLVLFSSALPGRPVVEPEQAPSADPLLATESLRKLPGWLLRSYSQPSHDISSQPFPVFIFFISQGYAGINVSFSSW